MQMVTFDFNTSLNYSLNEYCVQYLSPDKGNYFLIDPNFKLP
jgi:hypothetical protein